MCNTKKTRSAKYRTPYLYNTFVFCRFSFFNNIRDNRPFCRRRWWFPVNCVRTISQSKGQNIKVLYKSASQSPWMQNIYMTEQFLSAFFFSSNDAATTASSLSRKQWDTAKQQAEHFGPPLSPRLSPKLCSFLMAPPPTAKKRVKIKNMQQ